ncbi:MAG: Holliday junction resolvase RuvX [SAR202 cluster bacterium]|nr:Holliday junction resolvase RuvX [SAR202 cluster bacterium]|tara:strand:- start:45 stop:476 length:432 start_codon:yes stop_codon:yes gene_type:complete
MAQYAGLRVLGLDVGERRIGMAISDPTCTISSPLSPIVRSNEHEDIKNIINVANDNQVKTIVVGLPISLSGTLGPQGRKIKLFIKELSISSNIPVRSQDERFSTVEAQKLLREGGHKPSHNKGLLDSASAAIILQSYLDRTVP